MKCKKITYETKKDAKASANKKNTYNKFKLNYIKQTIYKCPDCCKYHLTGNINMTNDELKKIHAETYYMLKSIKNQLKFRHGIIMSNSEIKKALADYSKGRN